MLRELKILFVEDLPTDYELAEWHLRKNDLAFRSICVDTQPEFLKALDTFNPDVIISDYMMPEFNGMQALKLTLEHKPEIPFIVLTGSINEETAVLCMKAGATDYVIKEKMHRLPFAVRETMKRAKDHKDKILAERQLHESEEKFRSLFLENLSVMLLVEPKTGNIIDANPTACKYYGYERESMIKLNISQINTSQEDISERMGTAVYGQKNSFQFQHRLANGEIRDVEVNSSPIEHQGKKIIFAIVYDVTQKKQAELQIRLQATALNAAANAIVITDNSGAIKWVNSAYTRLTGYSFEEVLDKNPRILKSGVQDEAYYQQLWHTILSGQVWEGEIINKRKDGSLYTENETITPLLDERGNVSHFIAIKEDITQRKQAENLLRKSEEKFRSLFQDNRSMMLLIDPKTGKIIDANPTACKYYGYESDSILTINISQINSLPQEEVFEAMRKVVNGKKNTFHFQHRLANGDLRDVEVNSSPIEHLGTTILLSIITDVTDRIKVEKAFKELNELLNLFIHHSPIYAFIKEVTESTNTVIIASENYIDMIGIPGSKMAGKTMQELFPAEFAEKFMADDWEVFKSGQVLKLDEEMDGKFYTSIKFPIQQGEKTLLAGYTIDLTERKQAEKFLEQKVDELMRFHNLTVDRELKMVELKKEINQLLQDAGKSKRYNINEKTN